MGSPPHWTAHQKILTPLSNSLSTCLPMGWLDQLWLHQGSNTILQTSMRMSQQVLKGWVMGSLPR